ncbi:biotin-dependent carboxyltransferase family protein [Alkalicoccus luteus]|uniref:Biotin-dependent carboxyltransferase n=1 Tax=Alkalicoccus luteus TaxID=1237094 RepID=A0A969TU44_9BACI|nr:biotin-dependent carboxyltransferase family protein [Alkalicoccus luteus]NJP38333.1 biotin-dependent carboxyltransferase [Alkalicoccus luteus]
MKSITITKQGLLTTIQDEGRFGQLRHGIPTGGAVDRWALRWANLLVGNTAGAAGLEVTMMGPELTANDDLIIAVTGADLSPELDGSALPMWTSVPMKKGSRLAFREPKQGARAYIAFHGGISVPLAAGSRSTFVRAGLGGLDGRELRSGDVLDIGAAYKMPGRRRLPFELQPDYSRRTLRIIEGPDQELIGSSALQAFYQTSFHVSSELDRMGIRLKGPELPIAGGNTGVSDATVPGMIQLPSGGSPVLLLADRQTSGGYPRIGAVIQEDLSTAAQLIPDDEIGFRAVTLEEAHELYKKRESIWRLMQRLHAV